MGVRLKRQRSSSVAMSTVVPPPFFHGVRRYWMGSRSVNMAAYPLGSSDDALPEQSLDLGLGIAVLGKKGASVLAGRGCRAAQRAVLLMRHAWQRRHWHGAIETCLAEPPDGTGLRHVGLVDVVGVAVQSFVHQARFRKPLAPDRPGMSGKRRAQDGIEGIAVGQPRGRIREARL